MGGEDTNIHERYTQEGELKKSDEETQHNMSIYEIANDYKKVVLPRVCSSLIHLE